MITVQEQRMETHFPVNVLVWRHAGVQELHTGVTAAVRALESQYGDTDQNAANTDVSTTQGGFQTPPSLDFLEIKDAAVRDLKQRIIVPAIERYLQDVWDVNPLFTPFLVKSWASILRKGH